MGFLRFGQSEAEEPVQPSNPVPNGIVDVQYKDGQAIVVLSGKIDASNYEEIQDKVFSILSEHRPELFVFNMDAVSYVSSAGLRMFSAVNKKTAEMETSYSLVRMREAVMKLFQMTGYASAFHIELVPENE